MSKDFAAAIVGCSGQRLSRAERALFRTTRPFGFIVFARNVGTKEQIRTLCAEFRDAVGCDDTPVFVDQEGGRVARLKGPDWYAAPPSAIFGDLYRVAPERALEACRLNARLIADDLCSVSITGDCAPVLDAPSAGAHEVIGDRAFSREPGVIARLGKAACEGFRAGGVIPVIKHIPGHGRATVDSHFALPVVRTDSRTLKETDFVPFREMNDEPAAMTAHVLYAAVDADRPATLSSSVIANVIRREIGFNGLLITDDLSMSALAGDIGTRTRIAIAVGCDLVLHCNGNLQEMTEVLGNVPTMTEAAQRRAARAIAVTRQADAFDREAARARLERLLKGLNAGHARML